MVQECPNCHEMTDGGLYSTEDNTADEGIKHCGCFWAWPKPRNVEYHYTDPGWSENVLEARKEREIG